MVVNAVEVAKKHAYLVWNGLPGKDVPREVGGAALQLLWLFNETTCALVCEK